MKNTFMAIDQYGQTLHGLKHPRKELLKRLGATHAEKMYQDREDGQTVFKGYIISGLWLSLFKVEPYEVAV